MDTVIRDHLEGWISVTYQIVIGVGGSLRGIIGVELPIRAGTDGSKIATDVQCCILADRWDLGRAFQIDTGCQLIVVEMRPQNVQIVVDYGKDLRQLITVSSARSQCDASEV